MDEIIISDYSLWFSSANELLLENKDNSLADQIFDLADKKIARDSKSIISTLIAAVPAIAELVKGLKKGQVLKFVFNDEVQDKINKGIYHVMENKNSNGLFKAVAVDSKGKIRALADLKWEDIPATVDVSKIISSMQGIAIQKQMREISTTLIEMKISIDEVIEGQYNDRLSQFLRGEALYREALSVKDLQIKKELTTVAISVLTDSITSLELSLASEIEKVSMSFDEKKNRFNLKTDELEKKMLLINTSFQAIHKASELKTAIYYNEKEYGAAIRVMSDYKSFLERSLSENNMQILYYADKNESNLDGTWNMRKNELPQRIDNTKAALMNPANYELKIGEKKK